MRHFVFMITLILSNLSCHATSQIPKPFQGLWDASADACKKKYSDMRLRISKSGIEYWESYGNLIEIINSKHFSLTARFVFIAEGESWESNITYFLGNEQSDLVQAFDDGARVTRVRCIDA